MTQRPSFSKGFTLALRITFVLMLTGAIMIGVLKLLERTGDPLRQGVERALADMTQSHVYLETLDDPEFFPNVHMTLENIAVSSREDATVRLGSADKIEFSIPFFGMLFGNPRFEILSLTNIRVEKSAMLPRALHIERASIEPSSPTPVFSAMGRLGETPATLRFDIVQKSSSPARYTLGPVSPMVFTLGGVVVSGQIKIMPEGTMLHGAEMKGDGGTSFGPADFFVFKNQSFVKDNPISCLLAQPADLKLTPSHPCATLFDQTNEEDPE